MSWRDTGPDEHQRSVVELRAAGRCEICGLDEGRAEMQHRQPRKMGGTRRARINSPANLLLLCPACHRMVESNRTDGYENGWLVREPTDPARVPALVHGHGLVLLTADGRYAAVGLA